MKQKLLRMRHAWYLLAACLTLLIPWGGENAGGAVAPADFGPR